MSLQRITPAPGGRRSRAAARLDAPPVPGLRAKRPGVLGRNLFWLSLRGYWLLDDVAGAARVHLDAGTHRAAERDGPQIAALGRRGLRADQLIDHRRVVLEQATIVEAAL